MDILATALGRLDNLGQVVGVSGRVGQKKFFGKKKQEVSRSSVSTEEIDAVVEAREEARVNEVVDARVDAVVGERVAAEVASFKSQFEWMTSQL